MKKIFSVKQISHMSDTHTTAGQRWTVLVALGPVQSAGQRVTMWWHRRCGQSSGWWRWWAEPHINLQLSCELIKLAFSITVASGWPVDCIIAQASHLMTYNSSSSSSSYISLIKCNLQQAATAKCTGSARNGLQFTCWLEAKVFN